MLPFAFSYQDLLVSAVPWSTALALGTIYWFGFSKLRNVRIEKEKLVTDTVRFQETIPYQNIVWIYQTRMLVPKLIVIKYHDEEAGNAQWFTTIPSQSEDLFMLQLTEDSELTDKIRLQCKMLNSNYDKSKEPNPWLPTLAVFLGWSYALFSQYSENLESLLCDCLSYHPLQTLHPFLFSIQAWHQIPLLASCFDKVVSIGFAHFHSSFQTVGDE